MISVIVPVYNVKPYLGEAVESILGQSFRDLEIVLVDDGSTDGCGEICDEYAKKDARVRVLHQKNKGLSAARNAGLDICTGDEIAFLDPDDAFCADALLTLHGALETSGADIAECDLAVFYGERRLVEADIPGRETYFKKSRREGLYSRNEALAARLKKEIACYAWNKLYKRTVWETRRFSEGQNYEDKDIILPVLSAAGSVYLINEPLVMHRKNRRGSILSTYDEKNIRDMELADRHYLDFIAAHIPELFDEEMYDSQKRIILHSYLARYYVYVRYGRTERAACLARLGGMIDDIAGQTDLKKCPRKTRALYALYRRTPPFVFVAVYGAWLSAAYLFRKFRLS